MQTDDDAKEGIFTKMWNKRNFYRRLFVDGKRDQDTIKAVLDDLREFCRADQSCVVVGKDGRVDTYATCVAEGRRETYLRILQTINLSDETLFSIKEMEDV